MKKKYIFCFNFANTNSSIYSPPVVYNSLYLILNLVKMDMAIFRDLYIIYYDVCITFCILIFLCFLNSFVKVESIQNKLNIFVFIKRDHKTWIFYWVFLESHWHLVKNKYLLTLIKALLIVHGCRILTSTLSTLRNRYW